jgi:hypothetical protein
MLAQNYMLDFSSLPFEEGLIFPYCCGSAYFFFWDMVLCRSEIDMISEPEQEEDLWLSFLK